MHGFLPIQLKIAKTRKVTFQGRNDSNIFTLNYLIKFYFKTGINKLFKLKEIGKETVFC